MYMAVAAVIALIIGFVGGYFIAPGAGPAQTITETVTKSVGAQTVTQTVTRTETVGAAAAPYVCPSGKVWVPIVNKFMTFDEIKEAIKKEGSVTVADWTYWGLIDTYFKPSFEKYVKDHYGVDVEMKILGTQEAKGGFMYQVYTAKAAGLPPPYDAMHIEVNFFQEALAKDIMEPFLPSPIVPNLNLLDPQFFAPYLPYGVQFQQHAFCEPVINLEQAGWLKNWKDFADPRLKGKLTLWVTSDNGMWAYWVMTAYALGLDYKNPDHMKQTLEWVAKNVHPNVLKYTSDEAELIELSEGNTTWVNCYWCCSPEMEQAAGNTWLGSILLEPYMPSLHGVAWIPKGVQKPILAQLYVDWLLSPEFQFPKIDDVGFKDLDLKEAKKLWAGMTEGPMGPYYEQFIPDWWGGKDNYYKVFPTYQAVKEFYIEVDWLYVNEHAEEWVDYYESQIT